jgi:hypothetical protein
MQRFYSFYWLSLIWLLVLGSPHSGRAAGRPTQWTGVHPNPTQYVHPFTYRGQEVPQLRVPEKLASRKGYNIVVSIEQVLQAAHQALLADSLQPVLTSINEERLPTLLAQAQTAWPWWGINFYEQETAFYRVEGMRRAHRREVIALQEQLRKQQLAEAAERASDSLARIQQQLLDDSLQVLARQERKADSLHTLAERMTSPRRYVNATRLNLRSSPSATAPISICVLAGSAVELRQAGRPTTGWVRVEVDGYVGYLKAEYLALSLDELTVAGIDIEELRASDGIAYLEAPPLPKANQAATIAQRVYICNGQYAYAYHSYTSCPGLNNCRATLSYLKEGQAQQMGRSPCQRCFR